MKDEYLTIAEFAKRAGVTRQTVYNRLDKDLKFYTKTIENKKCLDIKALKLFGVEEVDKNKAVTFTDLAAYLEKQNLVFSKLIDALELESENRKIDAEIMKKELEIVHKEMEIKDSQIEALNLQIDQEQKLHAMTQQTSASAHNLLAGSRQDPDPSPVDQDEIDAAYEKGKADAQKQMVRIAKALSRNYPDAADFLIAEFDKKD